MVAVTGATGLLGGHILARLMQADIPVLALFRSGSESQLPAGINKKNADVTDLTSLEEAFTGIDTVIHAAAFVSFNPRKRDEILDVNVTGTQNVVNACLKTGVKHLIHISSVAALGRKAGEVTHEETTWTGLITSDYAESKYLAELEVYRGVEEGLKVSMVNPSVILSGGKLSRSSAALFDYVWKEKKFYTAGTLNYVDARDVAEAVFQLYLQPRPGEKFILSAGSISFRDFFSQAALRMNRKAPTIRVSASLGWWAGGLEELRSFFLNTEPLVTRLSARMANQSYQYDNRKAANVIGIKFRPFGETLDWCCGEYPRNVKTNK